MTVVPKINLGKNCGNRKKEKKARTIAIIIKMVKVHTIAQGQLIKTQDFNMKSFNDYDWHDSEILQIKINRESPGTKDIIEILIKWPNDERNIIVFEDCYKASLDLYMGIIAPEAILEAEVIDCSDQLKEIKLEWEKLGVDLTNLKEFYINTNSSNSNLKIFAKSFKMTL
jgi:hypothetical protein